MQIRTVLWVFVLAGCTAAADQSRAADEFTIAISGVRDSGGQVILSVYDDASEYARLGAAVAWVAVPPGVTSITLTGLTTRPLAVSAFHDENGDLDLDMQGGYPLEGYGSSGDVEMFDEPTFADAAVDGELAELRMHYLN